MRSNRFAWTPVILLAVIASACTDQSGLMGPEDVDSDDGRSGDALRYESEGFVHQAGDPATYEDRGAFEAEASGLPVEDFEEANVPQNGILSCQNPVSSTSGAPCFAPGDILSGVTVTAVAPTGANAPLILALGAATDGDPSKRVGTLPGDFLRIEFPNGDVNAVGLDLYSDSPGGVCEVSIFGTSGLLAEESVSCTPAGDFFGVTSTHVITRIEIIRPHPFLPFGEPVQIDNLAFGPIGSDPTDVAECKKGGWEAFGFSNQGQCVRFVQTGKDSRP